MHLLRSHVQKLYKLNFLIGWKVGFSVGVVWAKEGGGGVERTRELVMVKNESVVCKCWDDFGSRLQ